MVKWGEKGKSDSGHLVKSREDFKLALKKKRFNLRTITFTKNEIKKTVYFKGQSISLSSVCSPVWIKSNGVNDNVRARKSTTMDIGGRVQTQTRPWATWLRSHKWQRLLMHCVVHEKAAGDFTRHSAHHGAVSSSLSLKEFHLITSRGRQSRTHTGVSEDLDAVQTPRQRVQG